MKKINFFIALFLVAVLATTQLVSQDLDLRTREGKRALKRQKQVDMVVGAVNTAEYLSHPENREKVKKAYKRGKDSITKTIKEGSKGVKEAWKNRFWKKN